MTPLTAGQALDTWFLEARSKLLDLAAIFDRIGRGAAAAGVTHDPGWKRSGGPWRCSAARAAAGPSASSRSSRSTTTRPGSDHNRGKKESSAASGKTGGAVSTDYRRLTTERTPCGTSIRTFT